MRSGSKTYINIDAQDERETTPWYWRFIAMAASWMIMAGYLILPGLYSKNDQDLKISTAVLSVFVVALLTAGYSFTALLCFACRTPAFQAESIFLPALASSILGLVSIAYNFLSSRGFAWGTASIAGTVVASISTFLYAALLFWTNQRIARIKAAKQARGSNLWSDQSFYTNFIQNMYPAAAATRSTSQPPPEPLGPLSEDDRINQQMALLLAKTDPQPSPNASSTTFRIDLPDDREERERIANSQELVGTPPLIHPEWNRNWANSRPDSLSENQAWERWQERGRSPLRPATADQRSTHSRAISREERRREIELGRVS